MTVCVCACLRGSQGPQQDATKKGNDYVLPLCKHTGLSCSLDWQAEHECHLDQLSVKMLCFWKLYSTSLKCTKQKGILYFFTLCFDHFISLECCL